MEVLEVMTSLTVLVKLALLVQMLGEGCALLRLKIPNTSPSTETVRSLVMVPLFVWGGFGWLFFSSLHNLLMLSRICLMTGFKIFSLKVSFTCFLFTSTET